MLLNKLCDTGLVVWFAVLIAAVIVATPSFATTIDLYEQFPRYQGENGFYAEYFIPGKTGFTLLSNTSDYVFESTDSQWKIPHVKKIVDQTYWPGQTVISMHPGLESETTDQWAVLAYKAPSAGTYTFNLSIYGVDNGIKQFVVFTNENYNSPIANVTIGGVENHSLMGNVYLNTGDYLRLAVNPGKDGYQDTVFLAEGTITVPEPSSLGVLVPGLAALFVGMARRKR